MKFDNIIMNPPFQQRGTKNSMWNKFAEKSFTLLKTDGYGVFLTPPGYRFLDGKFKKIKYQLFDKQINNIEIYSMEDGKQYFDCNTRFDIYEFKNASNNKLTSIKNKTQTFDIDLKKFNFIPNQLFDKVLSLISNKNFNIIYSSFLYEKRKPYMSQTKTNNSIHPCIYSVLSNGSLNLHYSQQKLQHFGVPKLVLNQGSNVGYFYDKNGDYGLTPWTFGIQCSQQQSEKIIKAIKTNQFQKINKATTTKSTVGIGLIDRKFIEILDRSFYEHF